MRFKNNIGTFEYTDRFETIEDLLDFYKQSKKNKYLLIQNREIFLDGEEVKDIHTKIEGKKVSMIFKQEEVDWIPAKKACQVVYKDDYILVAHKEAGYIIHGDENDDTCLNAQVAKYFLDNGIHTTVRPIHRLDRETTGLVCYSLIPFFQPWLDDQLLKKKIHRTYYAFVYGNKLPGTRFTINKPIGKDRHTSNRYRISASGKEACTHFHVEDQYKQYNLIECQLETGRTHQIRVHLASCGLPIVNDPLYGRSSKDFEKMGLWAHQIKFDHPFLKKGILINDHSFKDYEFFEFHYIF